MFRITEDPSSGSLLPCLPKNCKNGSIVSVDMDKVCVMAAYSDQLCVCVVDCIGSQALYKAPCWSEICWGTFKYFIILILSTNYILSISWIIKCLIVVDARCKNEDSEDSLYILIFSISCPRATLMNKFVPAVTRFDLRDFGLLSQCSWRLLS